MTNALTPIQLDYSRQRDWRGLRRRILKFMLYFGTPLLTVWGAWHFLSSQIRLWRDQQQCLNYTQPAGTQVVFPRWPTFNPNSDWDGAIACGKWEFLSPGCWKRYCVTVGGPTVRPYGRHPYTVPVVYLHRMRNSAGTERLVQVEAVLHNHAGHSGWIIEWQVIDPRLPWGAPVLVRSGKHQVNEPSVNFATYGQSDPTDPSKFSFTTRFNADPITQFDCALLADDTIQITPCKLAASTQP